MCRLGLMLAARVAVGAARRERPDGRGAEGRRRRARQDHRGDALGDRAGAAAKRVELVRATDDFEMLAPVDLSIFCFRYRPRGFSGDLDVLNERIMLEVQRAGSSYLSNARVHGAFALRGCVLNYRTTKRDMEILLEDVRNAVRAVGSE